MIQKGSWIISSFVAMIWYHLTDQLIKYDHKRCISSIAEASGPNTPDISVAMGQNRIMFVIWSLSSRLWTRAKKGQLPLILTMATICCGKGPYQEIFIFVLCWIRSCTVTYMCMLSMIENGIEGGVVYLWLQRCMLLGEKKPFIHLKCLPPVLLYNMGHSKISSAV